MVCRQAAFRKPGAQHKVANSLVTIPAGAGVGQARGVAETEERIHRGDRAVSTLLDKEVRRGDYRQSKRSSANAAREVQVLSTEVMEKLGKRCKETSGPDRKGPGYNSKEFELCHSQVLHQEWMEHSLHYCSLQAAYRSRIAFRLSKACHRWSHRYQTATNLKANNAMQRAITSQPFQLFVSG